MPGCLSAICAGLRGAAHTGGHLFCLALAKGKHERIPSMVAVIVEHTPRLKWLECPSRGVLLLCTAR